MDGGDSDDERVGLRGGDLGLGSGFEPLGLGFEDSEVERVGGRGGLGGVEPRCAETKGCSTLRSK